MARLIQEFAEITPRNPRNLVTVIEHDMFYRDLAEVELIQGEDRIWDDPNLIDHVAFLEALDRLSLGKTVNIPKYQKNPGILVYDELITLTPSPIILVEGFMLHAVKDADATYIAQGKSITHSSKQPIEFVKGQEVIPGKFRKFIFDSFFGENGFFGENRHYVHCDEGEALFRRLLRDYMIHDRESEETLAMWPSVMKTYNKLIKPVQNDWKTIDNTNFTEETAMSIHEISSTLMDQAGIKMKKRYKENGDRATELIMNLADRYLDECVEDYRVRGMSQLRRFINQYPEVRERYLAEPIYNVLPEQIPEWLSIRV